MGLSLIACICHRLVGVGGVLLHGCRICLVNRLLYNHLRFNDVRFEWALCHFLNQDFFLYFLYFGSWLALLIEKLFIALSIVWWVSTSDVRLGSVNIRFESFLGMYLRWLVGRSISCLRRVFLSMKLLKSKNKLADTPEIVLLQKGLHCLKTVIRVSQRRLYSHIALEVNLMLLSVHLVKIFTKSLYYLLHWEIYFVNHK